MYLHYITPAHLSLLFLGTKVNIYKIAVLKIEAVPRGAPQVVSIPTQTEVMPQITTY